MLKLYARAAAGSAAIEALLKELGIAFELVEVLRNEDKSIPDWFKAINPRGEVPTLRLADGSIMTESAAIMIYLADIYGDGKLAPGASDPLRPKYLRAMLFLATGAYMADLRYYHTEKFSTNRSDFDGIKAKAAIDLNFEFDIFAEILGQGTYVLGERFSAADIYAGMLISWSEDMPALFKRHANLKSLYDAVAKRPSISAVWQRNKMPV